MTPQPLALVTGASSGIGAATARRLLDHGYRVVAAARRLEAMAPLAAAGATVLPLDIREEASRTALLTEVSRRLGPIDVLINNAGYGHAGPLETMALGDARAMYEVNVFGLMALTRQVLPQMRERRRGRLVNISSIGGRLVTPLFGWYQSSKFALEALSDALRLELRPFGVDVVVIEPGLIATGFADVVAPSLRESTATGPYAATLGGSLQALERSSAGASAPEVVADTILRALKARRPRSRYACGHQAAPALLARRLLPDRLWDRVVLGRLS
jgi:short-subunit dehydrogenase